MLAGSETRSRAKLMASASAERGLKALAAAFGSATAIATDFTDGFFSGFSVVR